MANFRIIPNDESDIYIDYCYSQGMLIPEPGPPNTIWNSYKDYDFNHDDDYSCFTSFLVSGLCDKKLETSFSIHNLFTQRILRDFPIFNMNDVDSIMKDRYCPMYETIWDSYMNMLEQLTHSYHLNGDRVFQ